MRLGREWIGLALVVAGLLRAALLVAHDPVMGYANQYDMIRTSACIGLYPDVADPTSATPAAPVPAYRTRGPRSGLCYLSTEVGVDAAVIGIVRLVDKERTVIALRWIGIAKLALLGFTALLVVYALHANPAASLVHGLVFLAVLADPVVTLWFDSLYTEFGAIWGLYATIAALCALAQAERGRYAMWTLLGIGILALSFSREQFALLAPALVLVAAPWLWERSGELAVVALLLAIAACLASSGVVPRPGLVAHVNRADTYLGVVLPASDQPQRARQVLGLPGRCDPLIGATWYRQRGENLPQACPEVFELSSTAFLRFLADEPQVLGRSVARALPTMQQLVPGYLGALEGARDARMRDLPWPAFSPLETFADRMPGRIFVAMMLVSILAAPAALLAAIAWARPARGRPCTGLLLAMLLGGTVLYCALTTVFGDGLSEAARHFLPGALAAYCLFLAALAGLPFLVARWIAAPKEHAFEMAAAAAVIPAIVLACSAMLRWAETQPLAVGVIDQPAGREAAPSALAIRGWALDPTGVERVQVELGTLKRNASIGLESKALRQVMPGYPDSAQGNFALDLTAEDLALAGAPQPLVLRVVVRGRSGATTEVDRRRIEFKP
ncbi:MAG: glycan biosynthesis hexose transferase WsfD [Usitatibacter sp.]